MYRPSKYTQHNDTLEIFSNIFNNCKKHRELQIIDFLKENFSDDGKIVNLKSNKEIIFDWEVRYKYFSNGDFAFETLGQFERKFNKTPPVDLSIQSDKQNKHFLVAWHKDFSISSKQKVSRTTDSSREIGDMRTTKYFRIYSFGEMENFKNAISKCLENNSFSFKQDYP
tara:strand:+ start:168 stop:674 length:507 start_codon:yes stop_codon:yes gene_type:complete